MSSSSGLPPTPASPAARSGHTRGHSKNKKSDPFLELPEDISIKFADRPSPIEQGNGHSNGLGYSLVEDLVLAPLNMVTFIISLFLVDQQQRQWRLSQHASGPESAWHRLSAWTSGPEPYQDSGSGAWGHRAAADRPAAGRTASFQGWYARKKHRAVAKLEMSDAFEMRGRVLVALLAWILVGGYFLYSATRHAYGWLKT